MVADHPASKTYLESFVVFEMPVTDADNVLQCSVCSQTIDGMGSGLV